MKSMGVQPGKFAEHARRRRANSRRILASPGEFKVCSNCFSVSFQRAELCPICRAYRWFYSAEAVKLIALITEGTALPFTAAVAPRLSPADSAGPNAKPEHQPTRLAGPSTN